jgi:hypothetical protein
MPLSLRTSCNRVPEYYPKGNIGLYLQKLYKYRYAKKQHGKREKISCISRQENKKDLV